MVGKWNYNIIGLIVRLRRLLLMISRRIVFLVVFVLIVFLRIRLIRLRVLRLVRKYLLNLIWLLKHGLLVRVVNFLNRICGMCLLVVLMWLVVILMVILLNLSRLFRY